MTVILPVSVFADNPNGAILHSNGQGVLVNGNSAPASAAIFANDLIQTQKASSARIEVTGSAATIDPETVVQFQSEELVLDHGSLAVYTRTGMRVRIGCITIIPVNPSGETLYEVTDRDGQVTVHASRDDVYIDAKEKQSKDVQNSSRSKREVVHEGEQKSRGEKCAGAPMKAQNTPGVGALMNSRWALIGGGIAAALVTCLGLCHDDDPISPWKP
ncbi:MAG TPA: hypothetical protein VMS18_01525 [Candidatus Binatia bacterium]|nr:hypothetical protein [Candidatus Binatia bacterium]